MRLPVSHETVRRWRRRQRQPKLAELAIRLLEGSLGDINPLWGGWNINGLGELVSPEGVCWTPPRLTAWGYEVQELHLLRVKLRDPQQWKLL